MGIKRYIADADNTLVNAFQENLRTRGTGANAGMADVLETFSIYGRQSTSSAELSRILIQFPTADMATDRAAESIPASGNVSFYLRLFNAESSKTVPKNATYTIMAVSQSWEEGLGLDLEGYKDLTLGNSGSNWMSASNTAYWTDINGTLLAGGSYHTQSVPNADVDTEIHIFKDTMSNGIENLEINITPLVEQWLAGTYSNYGVGVFLSASQEAYESGSAPDVVSRIPGHLALDEEDSDGTSGVLYNPSGSTRSYYTKRFFARGSQYFFKRPHIEARWDDISRDNRGNFFLSSSRAGAQDNMNTLYFYNYVRGQLAELPNFGPSAGYEKKIYVGIYSGSVGGYYADQGGGDGDDLPPSDIRVSGATSANTGSIQILSPDDAQNVHPDFLTVVTGGIVSTGIYSASFAFTGSKNPVLLNTFYDVWYTGSDTIASADEASIQFFTGTVSPHTLMGGAFSVKNSYFLNITNLREKYYPQETARFDLYVRQKNWSPNIYTKANPDIPTLTVQSASYRVCRVIDGYEAIPYGTGSEMYTGLSYDVSGNYFDLDVDLLEAGYAYLIKIAFYDSATKAWIEQDEEFKFRVEEYEY